MRAIVAVTDLTCGSDEALRAAARMAGQTGAPLHVVHGAGLTGLPLREAFPLLEAAPESALRERMGQQLRRAMPPGCAERARLHVSYAPAPEAVRERERETPAAVVVVGARAAGACSLPALAAGARAPVLVVRDGPVPPFERVLVPVGAGDLARRTLNDACAWLRPLERGAEATLAQVHVLHVCRRLGEWRGIGTRFENHVRGAERELRRMAGVFHRHVRWSMAPAPSIAAAAAEVEADLVVLRPGRAAAKESGAERTWIGVAERVRCGVLLLPAADDAREPAEAEEDHLTMETEVEALEGELEPVA